MNSPHTLLLGAVAYDPKVVTIWSGFKEYFLRYGLDFDFVLFSNYERQVLAHFDGFIHIAWNSSLAWLQSEHIAKAVGRHAVAVMMRDSDCDAASVIVAARDSDISSLEDLRGKRVAVGAEDSPQATLIPLHVLTEEGLAPNEGFAVMQCDDLSGFHGERIIGEQNALKALMNGSADAACLLETNFDSFEHANDIGILTKSPLFDRNNFTVLDGAPTKQIARFCELLQDMEDNDPDLRPLMQLAGVKQWRVGRRTGYASLEQAIDQIGTIEEFVEGAKSRWQ